MRLFIVAAVLLMGTPAGATAGTYTVSSCRAGWAPEVGRGPAENSPNAYDVCDNVAAGQGREVDFYRSDAGRIPVGDHAGWRFDAPSDTVITGVRVNWTGQGDFAAGTWGAAEAVIDASSYSGFFRIAKFDRVEDIKVADARWVRMDMVCVIAPCRSNFGTAPIPTSPHFFVRSTTVTLLDRFAPTIGAAAGPAISDATWIGSEPFSFAASDRGSGLYRVLVSVDGAVVRSTPAVEDSRCVDRNGRRDFGFPVPCPTQGAGNVTIPASGLSPGPHIVAVDLEDAAGNRAALMPPTRKVIVNDLAAAGYFGGGRFFNPGFARPRVLNGAGAVGGARLSAAFVRTVGKGRHRRRRSSTTRTVRFGERPVVRGTLKATAGRPIARATIFIAQRREGGQWRLDATVRTDAKGRFTYRPAAGQADRRLRAVYFPFSDSHENAQSAVLNLGVRAGMRLRVTPHRARNGQTVTFTGRVFGRLPAAGIAAALQAKVGRGYRTFRQLRASAHDDGRFRTVYRFQRTTVPVRYRFRLMVVRQAGLPFRTGTSNVVTVSVRP